MLLELLKQIAHIVGLHGLMCLYNQDTVEVYAIFYTWGSVTQKCGIVDLCLGHQKADPFANTQTLLSRLYEGITVTQYYCCKMESFMTFLVYLKHIFKLHYGPQNTLLLGSKIPMS